MNVKYSREDILEAGGKLIRQKGYSNTGINDIVDAAHIPSDFFYTHFKDKNDFVVQLIQRYTDNQHKIITFFLNKKELSPIERIKQYYQSVLDYHEASQFKEGCLVNNLSIELSHWIENLHQALDQGFNKWIQTLTLCISEGQDKGEIRTDISAHEMATYLHTTYFGALSRMKASCNIDPLTLWYKHTMNWLAS